MNAPRRWLDEGGGSTPSERDLLRSALSGMALQREAILEDLSTGKGELRVG